MRAGLTRGSGKSLPCYGLLNPDANISNAEARTAGLARTPGRTFLMLGRAIEEFPEPHKPEPHTRMQNATSPVWAAPGCAARGLAGLP